MCTVCCVFIDIHVFLVQQSSEYSDDNDDSEYSSSQQARVSSLAATCSQPTGDNFESASFLPTSLSSPISHLGNGKQHGM